MKTISLMMRNLTIIFLVSNLTLFAQTNQQNLAKYWHYRFRLVNYFTVVGEGEGMSLPANNRNINNSASLNYADEPVYLAYYISVLATEYALLNRNGQNTDQTLTELYYALKALQRLDETAEEHYPNGINSRNGFMIRSDVPINFPLIHPELNLNLDKSSSWYYWITATHPPPCNTNGSASSNAYCVPGYYYNSQIGSGDPQYVEESNFDAVYPCWA